MNTLESFKHFIWDFYHHNKREFAWRSTNNPYHIVVSEIMLQQTQTYRVETKYEEFIAEFDSFHTLAQASLRDVLSVWQGLGYYRRARFLHQLATIVINEHEGTLPNNPTILETLPGIGKATAGSICAFAFNQPTVFIETNIRSVFIHSFFKDKNDVTDKQLFPLIAATVDSDNPREWYYALMDYGVWLKANNANPNKKSKHYTTQSKFEGSDRQLRAKILKYITHRGYATHDEIVSFAHADSRIDKIINDLVHECFIQKKNNNIYCILEE